MAEKKSEKTIHFRLTEDPEITVKEIFEIIEKLRKEYPDRDIFFDGDEQAICSRQKVNEE
jgi:hypothetical protein